VHIVHVAFGFAPMQAYLRKHCVNSIILGTETLFKSIERLVEFANKLVPALSREYKELAHKDFLLEKFV
jgi:hypothetical protein